MNLIITKIILRTVLCVLCFSLYSQQVIAQQKEKEFALSEARNVLFLGNSITYAGQYVAMTESLLLAAHPKSKSQFINLGLPSETVSGLSEPNHAGGKFPRPCLFDRLDNVLDKIKAEVVFVCYGMNDGIYLPFDSARFEAYKTGILRLQAQLKRAGTKRIIWMTPPVHDDPQLRLNGYNKVLDRYAEWLLAYGHKSKWEMIDLHFPMKQYLEKQIRQDGTFKLAADGVHPGALGHWLMAKEIVAHLMPKMQLSASWDELVAQQPTYAKLYELVFKRQTILKDAWLTYTGHKRPGLVQGLPLAEALRKYKDLQQEIDAENL
ncbi:MAG: SGNH/GDSL hydrolase family protein [Sphingobacterium sp.]|nr:SGNH/GDSL hydrolase family protein [Sphingobacterium sp.]